jgi:prepilin-type N-terminal cleavage/methylation domain-containing protein
MQKRKIQMNTEVCDSSHESRVTSHFSRGFTLVEMIVSVFMFTIVMLVAVGALTSVLDANRRAQSNKVIMNNLHFALESMTREIRVGTDYVVTGAQGSSNFSFTDKDGCGITYDLIDTNDDGNNEIVRSVDAANPTCTKDASTDIPLTAGEAHVTTLEFYVSGTDSGDQEQPHVIIIVRGIAGSTERTQIPFNLETFVTQRFLDR